jgi:hypothetical protein
MKLGANEPKKLIFLGVLVALGAYLAYTNLFSSGDGAPAAVRSSAPVAEPSPISAPAAPSKSLSPRTSPRSTAGRGEEFHPVLRSKRPEDRIDPATVDPTLRLDLLAKVQSTEPSDTGRNLFQFGAPPVKAAAIKQPEPKVIPRPMPVAPVVAAAPPGPPPPAPIPLRYYGSSSASGSSPKTAFFLDGDEILMAKEGETLKRRYRVLRISVNSVVMEDTESKRQQTIPITEDLAG